MEGQARESAEAAIHQAFIEFESLESRTNWEDLGVKDDVHGYRTSEGDRVLTKGVGTIGHPPEAVARFLSDLSKRKLYMENLEKTEILHDFGELKVLHEQIKLNWPISSRDVVFASKKVLKGEDIFIIAKSVDVGFPEVPDFVRAEVILGAFYLKNIEDIATEVTHISGTDPKGSIPSAVVNAMSEKRAFLLSTIRSVIS
jgi:hypothetical protein